MKSIIIVSFTFFLSCTFQDEKKEESQKMDAAEIMETAVADIKIYNFKVHADSLQNVFDKIPGDSVAKRLEFATKVKEKIDRLKTLTFRAIDSINDIEDAKIEKENQLAEKKWNNSKAGKIYKKHPEWSKEDCERIARNEIWIGMSIKMLVIERGNPDSANPSNYGDGVNWQWCWFDYSPSCFYAEEDGIITSYN